MREIRKIYIANFLYGLTQAASVVFTLYFLSNGLSQAQISILFSIFMISLALLEIPTGAVSDIFGHKTSVLTGVLIEALYFLIFALSNSFAGFAVGMLCAALGIALQSGALGALIFEILKKNKEEYQYEKVTGRRIMLATTAGLVAAPIGSYIFKYSPRTPYVMASASLFLSSIFYFAVKHNPRSSEFSPSMYLDQIHKGFLLMVNNRKLLGLTIIGLGLSMGRLVFNQNINQPYLLNIGVSVEHVGVVAAIGGIVSAGVSASAYKITKRLGERKALVFLFLLPFITYFILGLFHRLIALAFILFHYVSVAYRDPLMAAIAQREIEDKYRATMVSTSSFLSSIAVGLILPIWGNLVDISGLHTTLLILGMVVLLVGIGGFSVFSGVDTKSSFPAPLKS